MTFNSYILLLRWYFVSSEAEKDEMLCILKVSTAQDGPQ